MDCFFIKFSYLNYYEFIELHHFFKKVHCSNLIYFGFCPYPGLDNLLSKPVAVNNFESNTLA